MAGGGEDPALAMLLKLYEGRVLRARGWRGRVRGRDFLVCDLFES